MPRIHQNRHRWKQSLEEKFIEILESATVKLKWSWSEDAKYENEYPINTDNIFSEIKGELNPPKSHLSSGKIPNPPGPAKSVHDLIHEGMIRAIYEQQHASSYSQALRDASNGNGRGFPAWKKISNCIDRAYMFNYGVVEFIPKPKVNFLHRELLAIAESLKLNELTTEGLAEFLDDLCPCGKTHNGEAIRKLTKRVSKSR